MLIVYLTMFKYPKYVRVPDLTKDFLVLKKQANGLIRHFFKKRYTNGQNT